MLNPQSFISQGRNPRALIKVNDKVIRKIDSIDYIENNYYQPDSFRATLPLYGNDGIDIEYWLSQPAMLVEILMGFPPDPNNYGPDDLHSMIIGGINDIGLKIFDGYVEFNGFDLSKKFIDNKTIEKYPNLKSSEIATKLAIARGLNPIVTPTTNSPNAGYYYNLDYVQQGNSVPEWDLLTYLAQQEGFQVFVRGTNLYFQPRVLQSSEPYLLQAQTQEKGSPVFNGTSLTVSRNLNYARDVIVNINSWNAKTGPVHVQARGRPTKRQVLSSKAQPIGQAQRFDYTIPGLSRQQATLRAQKILSDISQHERILDAMVPGDNLLRKDSVIQLKGVCESADQVYYPDTISRHFMGGANGYYKMEIRAKNHSPQSVVVI